MSFKNNNICISDFSKKFVGYGHYEVIYTSPVTGKKWKRTTDDVHLLDLALDENTSTKKLLTQLKRLVKTGYKYPNKY